MIVNIDGGFLEPGEARLPVDDGGFLYGETLFETLKARERKILLAGEHLDRLEMSARLLDFPCDRKRIESALERTIPRLTAPVSRIRLTLTRGSFDSLEYPPTKSARFVIIALSAEEPTPQERQTGAACVFAPNRRVNPLSHLPQMKRGNYADCLYAANYARLKGVREALFVTEQDEVLEGATSNLFMVHQGALITPPAGELVLAGIMRRQVLDAARRLGLEIREEPIARASLLEAEEVFLTNSMVDILPITRIENQPVGGGRTWHSLLTEISGKTPA
ncbi:aminotransferase class IV [Geoalkalibacter halelectricus]|uniref:branched-chain-amino-acid transaminase n=1 Tax=Geoalkalibacter halelectricus TaxID=2847045 RepID=A0ABY5ZK47_9BACT|nr:aminotransferase class IV [Geoalkalibacter halelectricus]MDO3376844.1 aminotransferase class IV [Geoalkalibacter halelectricus]UWZ79091.1 aminotransferase class IV [Geoalkalibacter halelectricus]